MSDIDTPDSPSQWVKDDRAATDEWNRQISFRIYGYIHQYPNSNSYCWQAVRGDFRLSAIVDGREAAMAAADSTLALPVQEFNDKVAEELVLELRETERNILLLRPDTCILPGYHAGYEQGMADMKRRIEEAIA